jgi:hypothetical protein
MLDVYTETVIRRLAGAVAEFAMDPDNAPRWYVNILEVEWRTAKPLRIGSQITFVARFLGRRRLSYTYEVVELVPERRLRMRASSSLFPMETTYTFEPLADGSCRMSLRNRGGPTGFRSLFTPLIAFAMRRANRKDLARLKALLEA